jgi:hypothetical protein
VPGASGAVERGSDEIRKARLLADKQRQLEHAVAQDPVKEEEEKGVGKMARGGWLPNVALVA